MCYTGGKSNLRRETIMEVTQRFLKYVSFDTTSSETSYTTAHGLSSNALYAIKGYGHLF